MFPPPPTCCKKDPAAHCMPQKRFNELVKQRQANTIDDASRQELRDLSNQIELLEADRIQQLAQLRSTSIEVLFSSSTSFLSIMASI
jgi:wobble nucleotide-excising tRNase